MKDAKELANKIYDNYGHGENNAAALIELDREEVRAEVRAEERRAFAEHLIQVLGAECEPHTMVRWGALVEDIRAEAAILFPEPIETIKPEEGDVVLCQWADGSEKIGRLQVGAVSEVLSYTKPIRIITLMRRAEVEARIAKEGI